MVNALKLYPLRIFRILSYNCSDSHNVQLPRHIGKYVASKTYANNVQEN